MHSYLRAVGFGEIKSETEVEKLLEKVYQDYAHKNVVNKEKGVFLELEKSFGPDIGIKLCGELDENGFHRQYYFPYFRGSKVTTKEEVIIERRVNGDSYAGVCDDERIGVSIIFYLQNPAAYQKRLIFNQLYGQKVSTTFSGLSTGGIILLPLKNTSEKGEKQQGEKKKRNQLLNAAKNGDPEAIESLTIDDMDLYSMISRRIGKEDLYSIVATYFMPYGIECDQYQIMGTITYYSKVKNTFTEEKIYQMSIECNDIQFDICINAADLMGEPEVGRRFKGNIWLQGRLNFE